MVLLDDKVGVQESALPQALRHLRRQDDGVYLAMKIALLLFPAASPVAFRARSAAPRGGGPAVHDGVLLQGAVGEAAGVPALFLKTTIRCCRRTWRAGAPLSVKIETPANHMTEESRWDYRVTITGSRTRLWGRPRIRTKSG